MVRFLKPANLTRWEWLVQRYWQGVDKQGPDDCWPWTKAKVTDGYGTIARERGVVYATHRLAYEIAYGPIPDEMFVMHSCDNPPCCNPKHLSLGTSADNVRDMINKKRGTVKLNKIQVEEIKADTRTQWRIAEAYGISQSLVSLIKKGKRWHDW